VDNTNQRFEQPSPVDNFQWITLSSILNNRAQIKYNQFFSRRISQSDCSIHIKLHY